MTIREKFDHLYKQFAEDHPDAKCTGYDADPSTPMSMIVHTEAGDVGLRLDLVNLEYKVTTADLGYINEQTPEKPHKPKGGLSGFVGFVLTAAYAAFLFSYFGSNAETLGGFMAYRIMQPHIICVAIAGVLSIIGFIGKVRWAMLVACILMIVAAVMMPAYAMFVIVQAVFFLISYARMC